MHPIVTLTSDLGEQEPNVASIKGVLHSHCPGIQIADLSHDITCRELAEGALFIASAAPFFPSGTVHLVNVAPGPTPIVAKINGHYFVCSDNGVLSLLGDRYGVEGIRTIAISDEMAQRQGQIFYGREVFAPAAAALVAGTSFEELGSAMDNLHRADLPKAERKNPKLIVGELIHVDRFGTFVTNIHRDLIGESTVREIQVGDFPLPGLSESYTAVPKGKPLALIGSTGYMEIAYNGDRADERLGMKPGIFVRVSLTERS